MIPVTYIKRNISTIGARYNAANKPLDVLLLAKLAIIEVGGWVEMSMDDLVFRCGRKLKKPENESYLVNTIIRPTWGFDYRKNFRKMLIQAIGLATLEIIESAVDGAKFAKMTAALNLLRAARNDVAHTYVKHITVAAPIPAPTVVATYFQDIYIGLKDMEAVMKQLRLI